MLHFIPSAMSFELPHSSIGSNHFFESFLHLLAFHTTVLQEGQDEIAIISASGAMKPHGSSLNPYATSYIPISKREANKAFIAESSSRENIGANLPGNSEQKMCGLNLRNGKKAPDDAVASAVKNHPFHGSLSKDNSELAEMETFHTEVNMELELLQICFPGLSEQSLTDVYFANNADLDAAMDMLNQLEVFSVCPFYLKLLFHSTVVTVQTWLTNIVYACDLHY